MMTEAKEFFKIVGRPHRRINPCFMTGKGCVSTEAIDRDINSRRERGSYTGFMIVPFRPNISAFFDLCFSRYLTNAYAGPCQQPARPPCLDIVRADQVWRTGYVICQKICRKIQDSDFVIADISIPNPNVFYELGLAFGANQKIVVVYHAASEFGAQAAAFLQQGGCRAYPYHDLSPLEAAKFPLSQYIWQEQAPAPAKLPTEPKILFYERLAEEQATLAKSAGGAERDIALDFRTHVMAAVGVAIDNVIARIPTSDVSRLLRNYEAEIRQMKSAESVQKNESFHMTLSRAQEAFCMIIRTGQDCNPMSYFWLGHCHALGKNVIPITVLEEAGQDIEDLAFDVRALWHMTFAWNKADSFAPELEESLYQMIVGDFAEWSRKGFWDEVLGRRGKVSIFTGALHNKEIGREMIGDWDLRAASELTSFFAVHQYRAVIESPVYQIEFVEARSSASRDEYLRGLEKLLEDKNCVIIASPDVSPLTELVLGRLYGIPEQYWFSDQVYDQQPPHAVVAVKQLPQSTRADEPDAGRSSSRRCLYKEERTDGAPYRRGFESAFLTQGRITGEFVSQTDSPREFTVHAHLLIAKNPFRSPNGHLVGEPRYLIVLNGVSGPATFALTHALTGGGASTEFEAYASDVDREAESEKLLRRILQEWANAQEGGREALQCILSVTVGPANHESCEEREPIVHVGPPTAEIFDWRRIRRWQLVPQTIQAFAIRTPLTQDEDQRDQDHTHGPAPRE